MWHLAQYHVDEVVSHPSVGESDALEEVLEAIWHHSSLNPETEFLNAAIMQSHNFAKFLRICANTGILSAKQEKCAPIICNCPFLQTNSGFFCLLCNLRERFLRKYFN